MVSSFRPDIVILQLGSNDLVTFSPLHVGSIIEDFVRLLHTSYGVKLVCVCQTLRRDNATVFNSKVGLLTRYLRVVVEPLPYAIFWGHRGFWKARSNFYAPDGVQLNRIGQYKLYKSLQGAVLRSWRLLQRPPNWGVYCVLVYNPVILCHSICCAIFYRAFDSCCYIIHLFYSASCAVWLYSALWGVWFYSAFVAVWLYSAFWAVWFYSAFVAVWLYSALWAVWFYSAFVAVWLYSALCAVWLYSALWAVWFHFALWAIWFHSVSMAVWLHWLWLCFGWDIYHKSVTQVTWSVYGNKNKSLHFILPIDVYVTVNLTMICWEMPPAAHSLTKQILCIFHKRPNFVKITFWQEKKKRFTEKWHCFILNIFCSHFHLFFSGVIVASFNMKIAWVFLILLICAAAKKKGRKSSCKSK